MTAKKRRIRKETVNQVVIKNNQETDWLHQIAFWGLALLLFFPPYFRGLFFAPEQEKALMLATLVFWLTFLWRWLQNDHKFLRGPLDYFALALPLVYIISSFTAVNKGLAIDEVVKNILYFLTYWSASRLVRNQEDIHKLLHVIYISAIGVALAGLATATGIVYIKDGFLQERIYSTFQYPNALASYLGAVTLLGLYFWQRSCEQNDNVSAGAYQGDRINVPTGNLTRSSLPSYLYACGNFLLLAVLIGTKSRGGFLVFGLIFLIYLVGAGAKNRFTAALHLGLTGLLGVVAADRFVTLAAGGEPVQAWLWVAGGLLVALAWQTAFTAGYEKIRYAWQDNRLKYNQTFAIMVAVVVIVVIVLSSTNPAAFYKIADFDNLKTAFQRVNYMGAAWEMTTDRPLLGWGGGGWKEAYQAYMDHNYTTREVHSFYYQIGVETGFPGLLVVGGIWVSFLYLIYRLYRSLDNPAAKGLIWTLFAAFLMIAGHAIIDFDLSLSALTLVLWTVFGIIAGLAIAAPADARSGQEKIKPNLFSISAATAGGLIIILLSMVLVQAHDSMNRGIALLRAQQVAGVKYVEKAVAYNPLNAEYRVTLSQAYMGMGKPEEALAEAQRAVELSSYDIPPRNNLVQIAMAAGMPEIAVEAVEKTEELAPNRVDVYQNMIRAYAQLGQMTLQEGNEQEARDYFDKCLQVPGRMESYWNSLSESNLRMWRGEKLTVNRTMQLYLGQANYWLGEFKTAEKYLKQAVKDENLQGEAQLYLALVKEKLGQEDKARVYLKQAREVDPGVEKSYKALSRQDTL